LSSSSMMIASDIPRRRIPLPLAWLGVVGFVLTTTSPVAARAAGGDAGAALFQANCAGCHAGGQNFIAEKKTLRRDALEKFQSLDAVELQQFVQKGMPHKFLPFGKQFSDDDYADVTKFVLDQALGDKW